ncbi:PaeR7I family type II restriction endonuclease [Candidatus Poriferisodalis sp.]|uniref:PaeR7I family type II restriction endonuclease n=1 Tax=Candidatus Poriferisodalis sp. TaxID=3101277 RepID=UPI003B0200F2
MTPAVPDYEEAFAAAIQDFWMIKNDQQAAANLAGRSDGGTSGSVRAGKHMSPFELLIRQVVEDAGIEPDPAPSDTLYLPGFYRETKSWDVVLQYQGHALAIVEAKSQGSSLANNFNNRVEEAIGQAADVWKSHERGLLISGLRPWVGYLMIVEETTKTTDPKHLLGGKAVPAGMKADPLFDGMSYAERYATAFKRLDQERMLDATCVAITSGPESYEYPNKWLSFNGFAAQLWGRCQHVLAVVG